MFTINTQIKHLNKCLQKLQNTHVDSNVVHSVVRLMGKLTATAILPSTCSGILLYTSREPPAKDKLFNQFKTSKRIKMLHINTIRINRPRRNNISAEEE